MFQGIGTVVVASQGLLEMLVFVLQALNLGPAVAPGNA